MIGYITIYVLTAIVDGVAAEVVISTSMNSPYHRHLERSVHE